MTHNVQPKSLTYRNPFSSGDGSTFYPRTTSICDESCPYTSIDINDPLSVPATSRATDLWRNNRPSNIRGNNARPLSYASVPIDASSDYNIAVALACSAVFVVFFVVVAGFVQSS